MMTTPTLDSIQRHLQQLANPDIALISQRFFKTAPGEYGAGDIFLGIKVPVLRSLVKTFRGEPLETVLGLLQSPLHEQRLLALFLLTDLYQRSDESMQAIAYKKYLSNTAHINNWDLVDGSAPHIVGHYLRDKPRQILDQLAQSDSLWERRIAILATFHFIRQNQFADTLRLAQRLLGDRQDLMHKAVGWMLREVGKRDLPSLETFLQQHYPQLPRTLLRYAIERFPEARRQAYLNGTMSNQ